MVVFIMVVHVQILSFSFPFKPLVQMERLRPAAFAGSFNDCGLKLLFYVEGPNYFGMYYVFWICIC